MTAFLDWLQQRTSNGTVVRTVGQAITGANPQVDYPTTRASCNNAACSAGWYAATPVTVALSASDPQGDATSTFYTVDGTDPATSGSRRAYAAPFAIASSATVKFYSTDTAGHAEPINTLSIRIDAAAPAASLTGPADGDSIKRGTRLTVTASASDLGTGGQAASGVATVAFLHRRRAGGHRRDGALRVRVEHAKIRLGSAHPPGCRDRWCGQPGDVGDRHRHSAEVVAPTPRPRR